MGLRGGNTQPARLPYRVWPRDVTVVTGMREARRAALTAKCMRARVAEPAVPAVPAVPTPPNADAWGGGGLTGLAHPVTVRGVGVVPGRGQRDQPGGLGGAAGMARASSMVPAAVCRPGCVLPGTALDCHLLVRALRAALLPCCLRPASIGEGEGAARPRTWTGDTSDARVQRGRVCIRPGKKGAPAI